MHSPAASHRAKAQRRLRQQSGTILSFTTVAHPPAGFPEGKRTIALIEVANGERHLGLMVNTDPTQLKIGQTVAPRMRLSRVAENGLRIYDVAYEPTTAVATPPKEAERQQYLLALTGPSGVGKSTICKLLARLAHDYAVPVPIYTTRKPKAGDGDEYLYISQKKFAALQESGEMVASTDIPSQSEKRWYGYRAADIEAIWQQGKIPIVITEQNLLEELSLHYGRRTILSFGLLPPGKSRRAMLSTLLHRLRGRGRDAEDHIADRLKNAESDLDFFQQRKELFDHLVVNDELDQVIDTLKEHVVAMQSR